MIGVVVIAAAAAVRIICIQPTFPLLHDLPQLMHEDPIVRFFLVQDDSKFLMVERYVDQRSSRLFTE
jgi:hypothetical protein